MHACYLAGAWAETRISRQNSWRKTPVEAHIWSNTRMCIGLNGAHYQAVDRLIPQNGTESGVIK